MAATTPAEYVLSSRGSSSDDSTLKKLNDFREARERKKAKYFVRVIILGISMCLTGAFASPIILFFDQTRFLIPSVFVYMAGLLIFFTIPQYYLDYGNDEKFSFIYRIFITLPLYSLILSSPQPCNILFPLRILVNISILFKARFTWDLIAYKIYVFANLTIIQKAISYLYYGVTTLLSPNKEHYMLLRIGFPVQLDGLRGLICGIINAVIAAVLLYFQITRLSRFHKSGGFQGISHTSACQASLFLFINVSFMVSSTIIGEYFISESHNLVEGLIFIFVAIIQGVFIYIYCAFGFNDQFVRSFYERGFLSGIFNLYDKNFNNLVGDGAFMAQLLDAVETDDLRMIWLHHKTCGMPERVYMEGHHRDWYQVQIAEDNGDQVGVLFSGLEYSGKEIFWIDRRLIIPSRGFTTLSDALSQMRCVDGCRITQDLFVSSVRDESEESFYNVSRQVKPGERIDYFISHSWHDDGVQKYETLFRIISVFRVRYGRDPTFWFDKVCIDQQNINDGVRVLPINVMACQKMLLLCGPTYTTRLWCIWELFTLNCFVNADMASKRITMYTLDTEGIKLDILNQLLDFDVNRAHCYDPNEERRLRVVIDANGQQQFNIRVRALAQALSRDLNTSLSLSNDSIAEDRLLLV